jgi:predicted acetyltransferase
MEVILDVIPETEKSVLRNLLELYCYDFSEYTGADVNIHGLYQYEYLDVYWTEHGRHPFFIMVDGQFAGFALVRELETGPPTLYSMAEFFVMRKYRRRYAGTKAARQIFDRFQGRWSIAQTEDNLPAQAFWRKVIADYTGGAFEEVEMMGWQGPVQKFETPTREGE